MSTADAIRFCVTSTATSDTYTLSLHDALPILVRDHAGHELHVFGGIGRPTAVGAALAGGDRRGGRHGDEGEEWSLHVRGFLGWTPGRARGLRLQPGA